MSNPELIKMAEELAFSCGIDNAIIISDIATALQCARNDALEEAANWCEKMSEKPGRSEYDCGEGNAYTQAEVFIRALKDAP